MVVMLREARRVVISALLCLPAGPVLAADLGGDCCTDLEERVAELEATTVEAGNRRLELTLYGRVHEGLIWYDNGEESDLYVTGIDTEESVIGVTGTGTVDEDVEVSFRLELDVTRDALSTLSEDDGDDGPSNAPGIEQLNWTVTSASLGALTVGYADSAADATAEQDVSGAASWFSYNGWAADTVSSFALIGSASGGETGLVWSEVLIALDPGDTRSVVRYDTPSLGGLVLSASWGEDDVWDAAAVFTEESDDIVFYAAAGYSWSNDDPGPDADLDRDGSVDPAELTLTGGDCVEGRPHRGNCLGATETAAISAALYHPATGLYGGLAFSRAAFENASGGLDDTEASNWYGKLGIRNDWSGFGETSLFVDYQATSDLANEGSRARAIGAGIAQDIDAVGATAYLAYRHSSADGVEIGGIGVDLEDMDAVIAGMVVPF